MSSLTEGMPVVLLEAMQWRVRSCNRGRAIPELLDEERRGRLVAPNDLAALTRTAGHDVAQPRCRESVAAPRGVSQRYTTARMADEYSARTGNCVSHPPNRARRAAP